VDEIDLANQHAEMFRQQALREHLATGNTKGESGGLGLHAKAAGPGSKGICIDCGAAIGKARLAAIPGAVRCIDCQERSEYEAGGRR
jgi:phage/conjugal plasmid C-4 type zinc finger TraR family protein